MRFEVTFAIAAPVPAVWAIVTDPPSWPALTPSIARVEWVRGEGIAAGNQVRIEQPRLGTNVWEVTEVAEGRFYAYRNARPGLTTVATHALRDVDGSHAELTLGLVQTGPLAPLTALLVGKRSRRYVDLEGSGIKRQAEARAAIVS